MISVPHPERWWLAARSDLRWLSDPDEDDGHLRHSDRDERQWATVAGIVAAAAQAASRGAHDVDPDDPTTALVPIETDVLAASDRNIVASWFRAASEAPVGNPWEDGLTNGRHRLWNAWRAAPEAVLPIYSDLLASLDDVPFMDESFAQSVRQGAIDGLRLMPVGPAARSPRYMDELRRVARGRS